MFSQAKEKFFSLYLLKLGLMHGYYQAVFTLELTNCTGMVWLGISGS
jgi:hypothetical protein